MADPIDLPIEGDDVASQKGVVALGVAVHAAASIPLLMLGTMAVSIRNDLHFDEATLGMVIATLFATAALTSPAAGRVCDHLGARSSLRLAALGASVSMAGIAAMSQSALSLLPFVVVAGLALALAQPATDTWLSRGVALRSQGRAFGIKQAAAGPGAGLVAGLAVPLGETSLGWRASFTVGALLAALVVLSVGRTPKGVRSRSTTRSRGGDLSMRALVVLSLAGGLGTLPQSGFVAFAVSGAVASGISNSVAGLAFAAACVVGVIVRLSVGGLVDRRDISALQLIAGMLATSAVGFLLFMTQRPAAVFVALPVLAGTVWGWHGLFFLAIARANPTAPAVASSVAAAGVLAGAVAGPLIFGLVAESGYAFAWACAGAWSIAGMVAVLVGRWVVLRELGLDRPTEASTPVARTIHGG